MPIRVPLAKLRLPELAAVPEPRREEVLASCAEHPSMKELGRHHVRLMRIGFGLLPLGMLAYFGLSWANVDSRIGAAVMTAAVVGGIGWILASVVLYHRRAAKRLRALVREAAAVEA